VLIRLLFLLILPEIISCAFILDKIGEQPLEYNVKQKNQKTYCPKSTSSRLVSSNQSTNHHYQTFLTDEKSKGIAYQFVDQIVLWSLIQLNLRPDAVTPESQLQLLIKNENKEVKYFEFSNSLNTDTSNSLPTYLLGLEHLLHAYKSKYSLLQLAQNLDSRFLYKYPVNEDFFNFLNKYHHAISKSIKLKQYFFKGDDYLRMGESLPKLQFSQIIKNFIHDLPQKTSPRIRTSLISFSPLKNESGKNKLTVDCNYDMSVYENSIYPLSSQDLRSHMFGLELGHDSYFLAISGQDIKNISGLKKTMFFQGTPPLRGPGLCHLKLVNEKSNANLFELSLISTDGRDPGQHLFHIFKYNLINARSIKDIDAILKKSRHLFLTSPIRLVYESDRDAPRTLDELYKLGIPIYHAASLGKVWAHFSRPDTENKIIESGLLIDDRAPGHLLCIP